MKLFGEFVDLVFIVRMTLRYKWNWNHKYLKWKIGISIFSFTYKEKKKIINLVLKYTDKNVHICFKEFLFDVAYQNRIVLYLIHKIKLQLFV